MNWESVNGDSVSKRACDIGYDSHFLEDQETARMREVFIEVKSSLASSTAIKTKLRESQSLKAGLWAKRSLGADEGPR